MSYGWKNYELIISLLPYILLSSMNDKSNSFLTIYFSMYCSRTMGDRAQGSLALWTQELFCRPCWSVTANLDSISARGDFVCMGCLGVCVMVGTGRKMAADRWGYVAPHWWGMEGKEAVVFGDLQRKLKRRSRGDDETNGEWSELGKQS
jgi:hypothetical protein